ncbi:ATP-binding protein [Hydrogenophaga sp. 2FB]|uniref:AAA family ATPase n=1 Tax=Hydrogenophaga sp. 2FB TaxID=2502187 RepID=UPI0010FA1F26|nr:ATP-binding protein [Hydrogenophaga sp. 2FB]
MSLIVSAKTLRITKSEALKEHRERLDRFQDSDREVVIPASDLTDDVLADLALASDESKDNKLARAVAVIVSARTGDFRHPIPNFSAFHSALISYLQSALIDGWIYVEGEDGSMLPELIVSVTFNESEYRREKNPRVLISTMAYGQDSSRNEAGVGARGRSFSFFPASVVRRRLPDILAAAGLYKETEELKNEYQESMTRFGDLVRPGFAKQFRTKGKAFAFDRYDGRNKGDSINGRRVIHDLSDDLYGALHASIESPFLDDVESFNGIGSIPEHAVVRVFDLKSHDFMWVHADNMEPYVYDKNLRDKLVLPDTHRDLLDVMTTDIDAFVGDFVEGKSAGNVILCTGEPGVGKTLTAEVYAELIESPLYAVHSGTLGTTPQEIQRSLQEIFARARRWSATTLIDECDVYVATRGSDIEQRAIVAEFLRTLEYFEGLLFMTTNSTEIDDAFINRCAAIIKYEAPSKELAGEIWRVMSKHFDAGLKPELIAELIETFPAIRPRDIKMLLRLALRVSLAKKTALDIGVFRQCAMFRAISISAPEAKAA